MFGQKNVMPSANKKNGLILLFSVVLKRFCPLDSKNVFVFVLSHLEPELELFEVDDIGDDCDDVCSTIISQTKKK